MSSVGPGLGESVTIVLILLFMMLVMHRIQVSTAANVEIVLNDVLVLDFLNDFSI